MLCKDTVPDGTHDLSAHSELIKMQIVGQFLIQPHLVAAF